MTRLAGATRVPVQAAAFGEWFPWMLPSQRLLLYRKLHAAAGDRVRRRCCGPEVQLLFTVRDALGHVAALSSPGV